MYKNYSKCRVCKTNLKKVISFDKTPIGDFWLNKKEIKLDVNQYPLNVSYCKSCKLLQLNENFSATEMYGENYGYMSSLNKSMISAFLIL